MLKTIISVFLLCLTSVNAYAQWTSGSCVAAYSSCSAAGYEREDTEGYDCTTSAKVYIISGAEAVETTCYKGCTELATDCLAAGYFTYSSSDSYYYYNEVTIPGVSGNLTCYQNRSRYYSSCSAADSSYQSSNSGYCGCSSIKIYISKTGTQTTCYYNCKNVCTSSAYPYTSAPTNGYLDGNSCTGYTGTSKSTCSGSSATRYDSIGCNSGYCLSGSTCYNVCDTSAYKYTSAPSNATLSGIYCTGYEGTSGGSCTGSSVKRYNSFTCNSGYCKKTSNAGTKLETKTCVATCDSSTYKYTLIANATMSNPCTGYYNSGGNCETSTSTKYSSFTCNDGYCKSGSSCYTACSHSDYPYSASNLPDNATLSGESCSRFALQGRCVYPTSPQYSSFTCNSGYIYNVLTGNCTKVTDGTGSSSGGSSGGSNDCYKPFDCSNYGGSSCSNDGCMGVGKRCHMNPYCPDITGCMDKYYAEYNADPYCNGGYDTTSSGSLSTSGGLNSGSMIP
ncbi:MAG: hypothetical protein IJW75_01810 [Alphaproteobacteria bacterium]|nr:hypothetical protein [Alphaproteobacteria bacterium]